MFLISLANSLPRLASIAAFLCLVVAHLEWPDMSTSVCRLRRVRQSGRAHQVHEHAVDAVVASDLRVERGRHQGALTDRDDPTRGGTVLDPCQHLDVVVDRLDPRRPDEDRPDRVAQAVHAEVLLERVHLAPEGVAPHGDVETADRLLTHRSVLDPVGQHDHPGTRAEGREAVAYGIAQRLDQVEDRGELGHRRGLPARDDEAVAGGELAGTAYGDRVRPERPQGRQVLAYVALQGQHADDGRDSHRGRVG